MINPEKYVIKEIMITSKVLTLQDYTDMIEVIQKDAYNQAIDDCAEHFVEYRQDQAVILKLKK